MILRIKSIKVLLCFLFVCKFCLFVIILAISRIEETVFRPHSLQVPVGTTIIWVSVPGINDNHNLQITRNETIILHTGAQPWNATFWNTFSQVGTYHFVDLLNITTQGYIYVYGEFGLLCFLIRRSQLFPCSVLLPDRKTAPLRY